MKKAAVSSSLCAVVLLALVMIAEAQQQKKIPRIGYMTLAAPATNTYRAERLGAGG